MRSENLKTNYNLVASHFVPLEKRIAARNTLALIVMFTPIVK